MLKSFRYIRPAIASVLLFSTTALQAAEIDDARQYLACTKLAREKPEEGLETGLAWRDLGGGNPAEHCVIVAMIELRYYDVAARRLEVLAQTMKGEAALRADVLGQAGQAWLLHGDAIRAEANLTTALGLVPGHPDHLVDRARARAALADYGGAVSDLDQAIAAQPSRADAYVFRAAALRYLDRRPKALADAEHALTLAPNNTEALLERGILRRLAGDDEGARHDWVRVLELLPESETARLARANIERMDVKRE